MLTLTLEERLTRILTPEDRNLDPTLDFQHELTEAGSDRFRVQNLQEGHAIALLPAKDGFTVAWATPANKGPAFWPIQDPALALSLINRWYRRHRRHP